MMECRIVLVRPRNPLNIGAAARAMANFGFGDLALVQPYGAAWREARSAVGAEAVLAAARAVDGVAEAVADCTLVIGTSSAARRTERQPLISLPEIASRVAETEKVALLFGSEKTGLANEQLSFCRYLLRIPTELSCPSMNLAQAVAVCCYELRRQPPAARDAQQSAAGQVPMADIEALRAEWEEVLRASGYLPTPARPGDSQRLRRLLLRLNPSRRDFMALRSMIAQIAWKLRHNK